MSSATCRQHPRLALLAPPFRHRASTCLATPQSLTRLRAEWQARPAALAPASVPPRRQAAALGGRQQQRCTARLTSSRDSLDEELLERQQQLQQEKQLDSRQQVEPGPANQRRQPLQQQPRQRLGAPGEQPGEQQFVSIRQLQLLTELHVEDAYALGVAGSAAELAGLLGSSLRDGLCESQVSPACCRCRCS